MNGDNGTPHPLLIAAGAGLGAGGTLLMLGYLNEGVKRWKANTG